MSEQIGLLETVSLAIGGMIGGGIFAVLGVVAASAGTAAWIAFAVAGLVALAAGYSFIRLNDLCRNARNPIGQIEELTGYRKLAGMSGWLLIFGYVGTMAMYAFAFGSYLQELVAVEQVGGLPTRPLFSVGAVVLFGSLNLIGAHASGRTEDALVAAKVTILLLFAGGGIYYGTTHNMIESGVTTFSLDALTATAIAFVAFEGWELLLFGQGSIKNPHVTIRKGVYISIVVTTGIYILVALVTTNLVPLAEIKAHAETALAVAAKPFLGQFGFVLISAAAVISTASALNATMFSASRLSSQIPKKPTEQTVESATSVDWRHELSDYSAPPLASQSLDSTPSVRALVVIGVLTVVLTLYGNLSSITSFASGAFMTIFGGVSALIFTSRDERIRTALIPAIGTIGSLAALLALIWHLHHTHPEVLLTVAVIWTVVLSVYWIPRRE